jgi:hypothetical protein
MACVEETARGSHRPHRSYYQRGYVVGSYSTAADRALIGEPCSLRAAPPLKSDLADSPSKVAWHEVSTIVRRSHTAQRSFPGLDVGSFYNTNTIGPFARLRRREMLFWCQRFSACRYCRYHTLSCSLGCAVDLFPTVDSILKYCATERQKRHRT